MSITVEQTVFAMLTENTGASLLDSGGAYGRNWQRNQALTLEDFRNRPAATLEVSKYERDGKAHYEAIPTVDVFHLLTQWLELDDVCKEFNAMPVEDWRSDEFYGVSAEGEQWLKDRGFTEGAGGGFNTYNWCTNHSQILQGHYLVNEDDEPYLLLQIHGGCDARGGYTDAKLFKLDEWGERDPISGDCIGFGVDGCEWSVDCRQSEFSLYNYETHESHDCVRDDELWQDVLAAYFKAQGKLDARSVNIEGHLMM